VGSKVLVAGARAAGELDDEALTHKIGTIFEIIRRALLEAMQTGSHTESYIRVSALLSHQLIVDAYLERRHGRPWHPCTR